MTGQFLKPVPADNNDLCPTWFLRVCPIRGVSRLAVVELGVGFVVGWSRWSINWIMAN